MDLRRALILPFVLSLLANGPAAFARPDLEGTWSGHWATPLERDKGDFQTVDVPEAQARAYEARMNDPVQLQADLKRKNPTINLGLLDPEFELDTYRLARIDGVARSAYVTDPPSGILPISPAGRARLKAMGAARRGWDNPDQRPPYERCLTGYVAGPPLVPIGPEANLQIVQTRDAVVLRVEEDHDTRIVRLAAAHGPPALASWLGDSIGWYEGDTLVVETTGFNPGQTMRFAIGPYLISPHARVIERFRRVAPGELRYAFEVADPENYDRVWRGEAPLLLSTLPMLEEACHEGNHDLPITLAGARKEEADRAAAIAALAADLRRLRAPALTPAPPPAPRRAPAVRP